MGKGVKVVVMFAWAFMALLLCLSPLSPASHSLSPIPSVSCKTHAPANSAYSHGGMAFLNTSVKSYWSQCQNSHLLLCLRVQFLISVSWKLSLLP